MPHDDHAPMALQLEYYPAQKIWLHYCVVVYLYYGTTSHGQFYFDVLGLQEC